jgi:flagellar protein FlgJ
MSLAPINHSVVSPRDALAADAKSLNALKYQSGQQSPAAIQEAAKQLESLFMRELIKSMREATMKSGLLDSAQGDLGQDLLDQQFATQMSGRPGGLSELIAQQLTRQSASNSAGAGVSATTTPQASSVNKLSSPQANATSTASSPRSAAALKQSSFVQRHDAIAKRVAQDSGIPAGYMIGQAGHETGWGQREIKMKDGTPSFNLFAMKAGANWKGKVAEVTTTEYVNGEPKQTTARFRAYDSYEASFKDYARMISQSPRYAKAREQTGSAYAYASGLQQAGYATDPDYANKLSRAINSALNLQRALG